MYEQDIRVNATVLSSGLGRASTGTEQICVLFEYVDQHGEVQRINWFGYFSSEKSTEIADEALKNLGWDPAVNSFDYYKLNDAAPPGGENPIIGKRASLVLGPEDDGQGGTRLRVKFVNAGGGLALKDRMTPEDAKAFSARRRAAMRNGGGAPPAATRPGPAPQNQQRPAPQGQPRATAAPPVTRQSAPPRGAPPASRPAPASDEPNFDDIPF